MNQIVHRSNDRLDADMEVCVRHKVPIVITSLGARREINDAVHSYGGIVLHDVIDNHFARKAIDKGAAGLIAVAAGLNPGDLPSSDPSKMDFGSNRQKPKAWKEIWGCGQGIGVLDDIPSVDELVDRFAAEYQQAREALQRKAA